MALEKGNLVACKVVHCRSIGGEAGVAFCNTSRLSVGLRRRQDGVIGVDGGWGKALVGQGKGRAAPGRCQLCPLNPSSVPKSNTVA